MLAKTMADASNQLSHRSFADQKARATRRRASSCPSSSPSGPTTRERLATRLQHNIRRDARNEGFSLHWVNDCRKPRERIRVLVPEPGERPACSKEGSKQSFAQAVSMCNSTTVSGNEPRSSKHNPHRAHVVASHVTDQVRSRALSAHASMSTTTSPASPQSVAFREGRARVQWTAQQTCAFRHDRL